MSDGKELFAGMLSGLKPKSAVQEDADPEVEAPTAPATVATATASPEGRNEKPVILSGRVPFWLRAELRKYAMDNELEVQEILQTLVVDHLKKAGVLSESD